MNTLETQLATVLSSASSEVPAILKQALAYQTYESYIGLVIGVALLIGSWYGFKHVRSEVAKRGDYSSYELWYIGVATAALFGLILTLTNASDLIKIYTAPKVYMLEYLSSLIRHH